MDIIVNTADLSSLCAELCRDDYVTVDTEFMRESTYWPQLCLIQIAGRRREALIDPLSNGIDLRPFFDLMADERVVKVFHSARQDIEIMVHRGNVIPKPLFDTQIAAMVCGFGDQVSYENIARKLAAAKIDKTSRFTDWSRRPLTDKQLKYALADVTHLRAVYEKLKVQLDRSGREHWLEEEMVTLTSPATYRFDPADAWKRLKFRARNKAVLAVFMEVAAWREAEAQTRNVPRNRVMKDEALGEIAIQQPHTTKDLAQLRSVPRGLAESRQGERLMAAVQRGLAADLGTVPAPDEGTNGPRETAGAIGEVLKLALKVVCEREGVASRLVASASEVEQLALDDDADVPMLSGWRRELFGEMALALKGGDYVIALDGGDPKILPRAQAAAFRNAAE